jgi:hypothetical protein
VANLVVVPVVGRVWDTMTLSCALPSTSAGTLTVPDASAELLRLRLSHIPGNIVAVSITFRHLRSQWHPKKNARRICEHATSTRQREHGYLMFGSMTMLEMTYFHVDM